MDIYLAGILPLNRDSRNLITLRYDMQLGQFDQGNFVIVPKSGQLVIHFIRPSAESAQLYHNTIFDHRMAVSNELLYARFAWELIKMVGNSDLDSSFTFLMIMGVGPAEENANAEMTAIVDKRIMQYITDLVAQPRDARYAVLRMLMQNVFWFDIQLLLELNGHTKDIDLADARNPSWRSSCREEKPGVLQ